VHENLKFIARIKNKILARYTFLGERRALAASNKIVRSFDKSCGCPSPGLRSHFAWCPLSPAYTLECTRKNAHRKSNYFIGATNGTGEREEEASICKNALSRRIEDWAAALSVKVESQQPLAFWSINMLCQNGRDARIQVLILRLEYLSLKFICWNHTKCSALI
jgi:hypothetical protein